MVTLKPRAVSARASSFCCSSAPPTNPLQYSGASTRRLFMPTIQTCGARSAALLDFVTVVGSVIPIESLKLVDSIATAFFADIPIDPCRTARDVPQLERDLGT